MDLQLFDSATRSQTGVWVPLRDPRTGNPTNIEFLVAGPDSSVYKQTERRVLRARDLRVARDEHESARLTEDEKIDLVGPCILDWRNVEKDGETLQFSPKNVRQVLIDYPIILRQLDVFISDARNFLVEVAENLSDGRSGDSDSSAPAQAMTS